MSGKDKNAEALALLEWYDRSARSLPWRAPPGSGVRTAPYHVWLSEIMLQQTTVAAVGPYFQKFIARWPTVSALAAEDRDVVLAAWAGLGYYARARNLHACAQHVAEALGGVFPASEEELLTLPGVGPYTASAIAAIAYDLPATPVDGNYERVISRLYAIMTPLPDSKPEIRAKAQALTPQERPGDFAQAMMDLGATVCTPKSPACGICPWIASCEARRAGVAAELPRKRRKPPKPTRRGVAFVACDTQGRLLLRKRPDSGLLGGMLGYPGGDWVETDDDGAFGVDARPFDADWRRVDAEARHTFTHFHLRLQLYVAEIADAPERDGDLWIGLDELDSAALPTLMRKATALALSELNLGSD